ncbi:MAG TPA: tetratricopeptide repeat protein [bacterium]
MGAEQAAVEGAPPRSATAAWRQHLWPILLVVTTVALAYARALTHGFLSNWDDTAYVVGNPAVRGITLDHVRSAFTSLFVGNYAPLQIVSYMLDYELWGLQAGGFILTNLLCHAASAVLVYLLLARLHGGRAGALVGALVFALHPVQVESVAWVSQRKNVLAMLLFLAALHAYVRYRERDASRAGAWYAASLAAFILALLTKSVTVVLPLVLVALDFCFPTRAGWRRRVGDKVPFCLAAAGIAVLALISQSPGLGGGRAGYWGGSLGSTLLTMAAVLVRYATMIVWPLHFSAGYAQGFKEGIDGEVALSAALLLATALAALHLLRRQRALGFWVLVVIIGLAPVSQLVPLVTLMNDRYLYFPMLGVAGLAGGGLQAIAVAARPRWRTAALGGSGLALTLLAALSFQQVGVWRDTVTLWRHATVKEPDCSLAWLGLGAALLDRGQVDEALAALQHSYMLFPGDQDTLYQLGFIYTQRLRQPLRGRPYLLALTRLNPRHAAGLTLLGDSYLMTGEREAAAEAFRRARAIPPPAAAPFPLRPAA